MSVIVAILLIAGALSYYFLVIKKKVGLLDITKRTEAKKLEEAIKKRDRKREKRKKARRKKKEKAKKAKEKARKKTLEAEKKK